MIIIIKENKLIFLSNCTCYHVKLEEQHSNILSQKLTSSRFMVTHDHNIKNKICIIFQH